MAKLKTSLRVDEELYALVKKQAQERGQTFTMFVERALQTAVRQDASERSTT